MKKTIIIPYHSNFRLLCACYQSLKKTIDSDTDILVVANNSDKKYLNIDKNLIDCKIIKVNENLFYPSAINYGAYNAKGDVLIFADADTYYSDNEWQSNLLYPLFNENDVGYTGAKLLNPKNGRIIDFGIACTAYNFPHPFKNRYPDYPLTLKNYDSFGTCAACSAIFKDVFLQLGGFDNKLVHSYSDIDLSIRLRRCGLKTKSVHNSIVFHQGASTIGSGMSENLKEDTKGIFCAKNADKLIENMHEYINISGKFFKKKYNYSKQFICVDISTIADSKKYIEEYSKVLSIDILYIYHMPYKVRDAEQIDLINTLDYNFRAMKTPILYFTDNYLALNNNSVWYNYRDCSQDIVIDRNFNITSLL